MRKILVTGGTAVTGYAFNSIKQEYPNDEFKLIGSKDCDLTSKEQTFDFIKNYKPNAIIHLAALCGGIGLSAGYPADVLRENVIMNFNILDTAAKLNLEKVIMTLSAGMYPPTAPLPLKEEYIHEGDAHISNYGYSHAKRLIEPSIRAYRKQYGLNVIGLVPNGVFGENDNYNEEDATMLPTLIKRFYENKDKDTSLIIWGDGSPLREYTYSKDIARANMWCLDNYNDSQILNIGSIEERTVLEIAGMIADNFGIDKNRFTFDTSKPEGVFKKSTDNSKFVGLSGFKYTPFEEGLKNTIKWFVETYENYPELIRTYIKMKGRR
jgi:GDP-L-fucose synthase